MVDGSPLLFGSPKFPMPPPSLRLRGQSPRLLGHGEAVAFGSHASMFPCFHVPMLPCSHDTGQQGCVGVWDISTAPQLPCTIYALSRSTTGFHATLTTQNPAFESHNSLYLAILGRQLKIAYTYLGNKNTCCSPRMESPYPTPPSTNQTAC